MGILGGTGPEGRGLAVRLAAAGVPVLLGSRERERARAAVERWSGRGPLPLEPATNDEVVDRSDLVVLAVPFGAAAAVVESYAGAFRAGTVVVDVTVPLRFEQGAPSLDIPPEGSAAEHLRARLPSSVGLAAALKTIPAHVMDAPDVALDCDTFVCGDAPESVRRTMDVLVRIPGLRPVDAGGLASARALEHMTLLAVGVNKRYRVRSARFRLVGLGTAEP